MANIHGGIGSGVSINQEMLTDDKYRNMIKERQSMLISGVVEDDTIEDLAAQLIGMTEDSKLSASNLRYALLGAWPSDPTAPPPTAKLDGMVPNLKEILRICIRNTREAREHIAVMSNGVR